jgi:hypothetical protein
MTSFRWLCFRRVPGTQTKMNLNVSMAVKKGANLAAKWFPLDAVLE